MNRVFLVREGGLTSQLQRLSCKNEDKELQSLLENNLDILPGEQMNPGSSLRWLLVKREMPVVSPATGEVLWSVDFLLADQFGIPTLVECKRSNDPRSRREVVGQMLDYAANGRHYWTASEFRSHAQGTAGNESNLNRRLAELTGSDTVPEEFFSIMEQNLQRAKIRLIFFLENSSSELRSIVEFLNGQFKDTEVLIVEARQFEQEAFRIVVPFLFGFTEEARAAKRESKAETVRSSLVKGEEPFWESMQNSTLSDGVKDQIREFVNTVRSTSGCSVDWQRSCIVSMPGVVPENILFAIRFYGPLELYLARWKPQDGRSLTIAEHHAKEVFFHELQDLFGFSQAQLEKQYPQVSVEDWVPKADRLLALMRRLAHPISERMAYEDGSVVVVDSEGPGR